MITEAISGLLLVWAFATTIYSLHLARQNNIKYNERIVSLLENISRNVKRLYKEEKEDDYN